MRLRPFWIINTPIGWKKIFLLYSCIAVVVSVSILFAWPVLLGGAIKVAVLCTLISIFLGIVQGAAIVQKTFTVNGKIYFVRDFIFPLKRRASFRDIYPSEDYGTLARLYLKTQKKWSYLDSIRELVTKNLPKKSSALVLGGGGATIPLGLLENFQISSDVVEISPAMIQIAHQFFLPLRERSFGSQLVNIQFIQADAFQFILKNKKHYGLVVVDIFNGTRLLPKTKNETFIRKLVKTGEYILVNFGIEKTTKDLHRYFTIYTKIFRYSKIYSCRGNYIGIFSNKKKIKDQIDGQQIF